MQIRSFATPESLSSSAAEFVCDVAQESLARAGIFSLVLSGGSTPANTYRMLAQVSRQRLLDWSKVEIFWGDERCVAPTHEESNYRMACKTLLDQISIPEENLHRMACEGDPTIGARNYEQTLRSRFSDQALPRFDLILLGLGEDGHTASLFPGSEILEERERWVAPTYVPHLDSWRISLTFPLINAASNVVFLVSGESKATILKEVLAAPAQAIYPAQRVAPQGELLWFIDHAAGQLLNTPS